VSRLESACFIAHPGAGRGAFARVWPPIADALEAAGITHEVQLTTRAGEAGELARRAADAGVGLVVAVGGDGTLHEVVNGLMEGRSSLPPSTVVGLVPAGRGSDYARGLGLPADPHVLVGRFAAAIAGDPEASRRVDLGEVHFATSRVVAGRPLGHDEGAPSVRRFINGAGIGFSTFITQRTARFPPRLGAYLYTVAGLVTIVDWRDRAVEITWDDGTVEHRHIESVEVALGAYEGGGMRVAPQADPADGLFDAVLFEATSRWELFTFSWRLRSGDHLRSPRVSIRRTSRLTIEIRDDRGPLYLQADGELLGRDPFRFEILPAALSFVC
jgi:diacylglycerol kinase (ATP)